MKKSYIKDLKNIKKAVNVGLRLREILPTIAVVTAAALVLQLLDLNPAYEKVRKKYKVHKDNAKFIYEQLQYEKEEMQT